MQADELAGKDSELALSGDLDEGKNIQPLMIVASSLCDPRPTGTWPCCYCTLKFTVVIKVTQVVARVTAQLPHWNRHMRCIWQLACRVPPFATNILPETALC